MTTRTRTPERAQFLADLLSMAIEHGGYGFPGVIEYKWEDIDPADTYAVIRDRYEDDDKTTWRVDIGTMARGLGLIRRAFIATDGVPSTFQPDGSGDVVLVNPDTWERMYLSTELRREIGEFDRSNGEEGDLDVIGALAVLEVALFGAVTYA